MAAKAFVLLLVMFLLGGLLLAALPATAAPDITVLAESAENRYPVEAHFYLQARSSADITKVTLYYQFTGNNTSAYAYPEFTPGQEISIDHRWDTRSKYVAPGSEMEYYWQIEDASGGLLKTEPTRFTFDDTRFQWRSLRQDDITLMWYQGDETFARQLLEAAVKAAAQLSQDAGVEMKAPVKIMIYGSQRDMMGALVQGSKEWTGGVSFSEMSIVVIAAGPDSSGRSFGLRTVPHELSHVVIHRATDNPYADLPRWLDEGLAMYAEGEQEPSYPRALERAVSQNRLLSLRSISGNFPTDSNQAHLAYAQSYSVVKYIIDAYGRDGMGKLLQEFAQGTTADRALQRALGTNLAGLEADWRASIGAQPVASAAGRTAVASSSTPAPSGSQPSSSNFRCAVPAVALAGVALIVGGGSAWWRRRW